MTMQVGMVGDGGVLIASDTLVMDKPKREAASEEQSPVRDTSNESKIIINYKKGIAISCAGTMRSARRVARKIISGLMDEQLANPREPIEKIGAEVLKLLGLDGEKRDVQCLIIIHGATPGLYFFEFGEVDGDCGPVLGPICTKVIKHKNAGDQGNPAVFWKLRYYERKPIRELIPLAAHLVVSASKLNSGSIDGLEIVLCDEDGIHRLNEQSTRKLEAQAKKWDTHIGSLFSNYKIKLGFDPKEAA
jgi:hypothetical protein